MTSLNISSSTTPFVRAGRSNMVWPIVVIAIVMLVNTMTLPIIPRSVIGGFLLLTIFLGLRMYVTTAAQIIFLDDRVDVLLALSKHEIPYDSIEYVRIVRLQLTPLLRVRIKSRSAALAVQLLISGPLTQWGSLEETRLRLEGECRTKGIRVIGS